MHLYFRNYNWRLVTSDAAILILKKPFDFSYSVRPACLPSRKMRPAPGAKCLISGWGRVNKLRGASNILQWASAKIIRKSKCKSSLRKTYISDSVDQRFRAPILCAGKPGTDACQAKVLHY